MMPKVKDIMDSLERVAPAAAAEDWDNPGLQVGTPSAEVRKILMSLDPTLDAVREASRREACLVVTHHPLIFPSLSCLNTEIYPGNVISEACRKEISILAAHTNLDTAQGGINDMLASLFQLKEAAVLQPRSGIGRIGYLPEPCQLFSLVETIKDLLDASMVRVSGTREKWIRRLAVVGGSGGGLVSTASAMGADVLVTGDVSHHDALLAQTLGLALVDAGHFHTEKTAFGLFAGRFKAFLTEEGWDVLVEEYQGQRNPLRWD
jgi:dinuclear metal center YbgI/SA1388 family protein